MSIDLSIPRSEPPREIFADEGGEPKDLNVTDFDARAAAACCSEIAEQLDNLTHLITTSPDAPALLGLDKLTSLEENWRTSRRQDPSEAPLSGLLIEELLPDEDKTQEKDINPARSSLPTAVAIFLASMQWGDLQETTSSALERPWVTSSTRTVSINLLTVLFQHVQLVSLLPRMVAALRPAITAAAVHAATETSRLEPYTGPDSWQRSLAMGQLAAAVQWLTTKELWQQNEEESKSGGGGDVLWQVYLFPVLTLAVQDPSPIVQKYALWTLHHIFTISTAKELAPWAGKLVEITRKAIVGCDEKVWPAAAAAATSLALKLDNGGGVASLSSTIPAYNPHFISLFEALLNEGERYAHNPPRVRVWLQTIPLALFPLLGIQLTRYFRRLMPLLLEWCVSIHKGVRLGALRAVHAVVRATWPRLPAHAAAIWTVLESVYLDETVLSANTSEEIVREIVDIAVVLWKWGGETFQQQKLASVKGAAAHVDESGAGEKVASSLLERALSAVKSMEEVDIDVHTALCAVKIEEL